MTQELKPCPFCGGSDIQYDNCDNGSGQWYACNECGARVQGGWKDDVKALWNRRAIPPGYALVPVEPTEAMEQAAADYLVACVKAHGLWTAMLAAAQKESTE